MRCAVLFPQSLIGVQFDLLDQRIERILSETPQKVHSEPFPNPVTAEFSSPADFGGLYLFRAMPFNTASELIIHACGNEPAAGRVGASLCRR
jgi:hypothetical protein